MSSPYRDTREPDETEPMPQFHLPRTDRRDLIIMSVTTLLAALLEWVAGHRESAVMVLVCFLPAVAFSAAVCALEQHVRRWLDERYARKVVRGIEELESRAASLSAKPRAR